MTESILTGATRFAGQIVDSASPDTVTTTISVWRCACFPYCGLERPHLGTLDDAVLLPPECHGRPMVVVQRECPVVVQPFSGGDRTTISVGVSIAKPKR